MVKIGCKRDTTIKRLPLKRQPLKKVSKKQNIKLDKLSILRIKLRKLCNNKSELDGSSADWRTNFQVEAHHIMGRNGSDLINPFRLIMVTRGQHDLMDGNTYEEKLALMEYIKPIRLKQGFVEADYE